MACNYNKRGFLVPGGCTDLMNAINLKTTITDYGFVVAAEVPEQQSRDIEITADGDTLRIAAKKIGTHASFDTTISVPAGYAMARARAIYLKGHLRIVVPKAIVGSARPRDTD